MKLFKLIFYLSFLSFANSMPVTRPAFEALPHDAAEEAARPILEIPGMGEGPAGEALVTVPLYELTQLLNDRLALEQFRAEFPTRQQAETRAQSAELQMNYVQPSWLFDNGLTAKEYRQRVTRFDLSSLGFANKLQAVRNDFLTANKKQEIAHVHDRLKQKQYDHLRKAALAAFIFSAGIGELHNVCTSICQEGANATFDPFRFFLIPLLPIAAHQFAVHYQKLNSVQQLASIYHRNIVIPSNRD